MSAYEFFLAEVSCEVQIDRQNDESEHDERRPVEVDAIVIPQFCIVDESFDDKADDLQVVCIGLEFV